MTLIGPVSLSVGKQKGLLSLEALESDCLGTGEEDLGLNLV